MRSNVAMPMPRLACPPHLPARFSTSLSRHASLGQPANQGLQYAFRQFCLLGAEPALPLLALCAG